MRTGNGKKLVRAALLALMLFMFLFVYKAETARAEEQPAAGFSVQSPRITGESRSAVSANGRTVSFRVTAAGTGLSYRWQYSVDNGRTWHDSSMSGCTTSTIKIPAAAKRNGYLYRCIVKNSYGSVTSSPAKLTVSGVKPAVRSQTKAVTSAPKVKAAFRVEAAGIGLSYQWQYSRDGGKTWHDSTMTGCHTEEMKVPVIAGRNGHLYRCIVKNGYGRAISSPAKLTVSGVKPAIRSQTKAVTSALKETVTFKVTAAGTGLRYKWQYSADGGKKWHDSAMAGCTTASVKVPVVTRRNGYLYRCVVTNSRGRTVSSPAKLTAQVVKPVITSQPKSQKVECGKIMTMSVTAKGRNLKYQWQYSFDQGKKWYDWTGVTQPTVRLKASFDLNRTYYRCVVKNGAGSTVSKEARLICKSDMGCANKLYGKTVVISLFTSDSISEWNLNRKADANRYRKCLTELRKGIDFLKNSAKKYGKNAEFVFDWSKDRNLAQFVRFDERLVVQTAENYPLQSHYIETYLNPDEIMEKYDADNVVYIFYFNTGQATHDIKSIAMPWGKGAWENRTVEYANVYIGSCGEKNIGMVSAHEMLHTFGAPDLYYANNTIPQEYVDHLQAIDSQDIMFNCWKKPVFTDLDAYYVGLISSAKDVQKWGLGRSDHYLDAA